MLKDLHPTVRRYPRRMEDAFRDPVQQAQWFYPPERKHGMVNAVTAIAGILMWIAVFALLLKA
jgi:hypothetical protein